MDIKDWQKDENGIPIPPNDVVIVKKEDYNKVVTELAEKAQATANLTDEIKELRKKKEVDLTGIDELIESKLRERAQQDVGKNREAATNRIVNEVKELSDAANLQKFNAELENYNFSKCKTVEDFTSLFKKALTSAGIQTQADTPRNVSNPNAFTRNNDATPNGDTPTNLTPKEQDFVKNYFDGDEKEYTKQKEKRPEYIQKLVDNYWL